MGKTNRSNIRFGETRPKRRTGRAVCICPSCGKKKHRERGKSCQGTRCPKCRTNMYRD